MSDKIVYQLQDLQKFYDQREVLKGITLSFLEGAKIGLIGLNGAGKSTLLRIIAGQDTQYEGTAKPVGDLSVGYLSQEPPLDESKTVAGNIEDAVGSHALEARYYEVMTLMGEAEGEEAAKLSDEYDGSSTTWTRRVSGTSTAACPRPSTPCRSRRTTAT